MFMAAQGGPWTGVGRGGEAASPSAQPLRLRDIVSGLTGTGADTGAGRMTFLVAGAPAGLAPDVTIVLEAFMVPVWASGGDRMTGVLRHVCKWRVEGIFFNLSTQKNSRRHLFFWGLQHSAKRRNLHADTFYTPRLGFG